MDEYTIRLEKEIGYLTDKVEMLTFQRNGWQQRAERAEAALKDATDATHT